MIAWHTQKNYYKINRIQQTPTKLSNFLGDKKGFE